MGPNQDFKSVLKSLPTCRTARLIARLNIEIEMLELCIEHYIGIFKVLLKRIAFNIEGRIQQAAANPIVKDNWYAPRLAPSIGLPKLLHFLVMLK